MEPFFTFEAGIPPHRLPDLSLAQIAAHLDYFNQVKGGGRGGG